MNQKELDAKELFFKIIKKLNDNDAYYGGVFDCGELGLIQVYWDRHSWAYKFYERPEIIDVNQFLNQ